MQTTEPKPAVGLWLCRIHLALAVLAPTAHVLELPNKLALSGEVWLAIQQQLYRGWGPYLGAPAELGALLTNAILVVRHRASAAARPFWIAGCGYLGMLVVFFLCNAPVDAAVAAWTAATLPADWPSYRLRWEIGHAMAALLGWCSLAVLLRAKRRA